MHAHKRLADSGQLENPTLRPSVEEPAGRGRQHDRAKHPPEYLARMAQPSTAHRMQMASTANEIESMMIESEPARRAALAR